MKNSRPMVVYNIMLPMAKDPSSSIANQCPNYIPLSSFYHFASVRQTFRFLINVNSNVGMKKSRASQFAFYLPLPVFDENPFWQLFVP